jgi:splicing factor 3A subunit 2
MDRQNRVGSKFGGGGVSSAAQTERERKERLKQLALESIDLAKDPYFTRNHVGSFECKLCCTMHRDEANYLAHTQGKKHQQGLARRAHQEKLAEEQAKLNSSTSVMTRSTPHVSNQTLRIGRPAYQVYKSRDFDDARRCLSFEILEPLQPRYRLMSAFEQQVERPPNPNYQYLVLAAEPYTTIAFKVPNAPIDACTTHWDAARKLWTVTLTLAN